ncbi:MAG: hypothetical protein R3346_03355, partial [Candidatus Spechtbacterales bacterium]|nr:hypothetical protein [Candidatus Spechtbacterales bacterium]
MVQVAKQQINRHKKPLIIAGVLVFLVVGFVVMNFNDPVVYSASSGDVYPNGDFTTQFPNSTGATHWEVLDESSYDPLDYVNTGTSLDGSPSSPVEEFNMTSVAGASNIVSEVTVYFQAYIQGACQSDCDTITPNIYIDGGYETPPSIPISLDADGDGNPDPDAQYSFTFNGSWTGDDDLRVQLTKNSEGTGNLAGRDDDVLIGRVFANVTYHLPPEPRAVSMPSPQGETGATLEGEVDPNNETTTAWFVYGEDPSGGCSGLAAQNDTSGNSVSKSGDGFQSYTTNISGLRPATTYYYCAAASSLGSGGSTVYSNESPLLSFTTDTAAPEVSTLPDTDSALASHAAEINANVRSNGEDTEVWFRLWKYPGYSIPDCNEPGYMVIPVDSADYVDAGNGTSFITIPYYISESYSATNNVLDQANSNYYYCAVARNSVGTTIASNVESFTTKIGNLPDVEVLEPAAGVQNTSATLRGRVNPNNNMTDVRFHYSTSSAADCATLAGQAGTVSTSWKIGVGNDSTWHNFSETLIGLTPNTTYYYCAQGNNWDGDGWSSPIAELYTATSSVDNNVSGWAWSSTVGWVSFSSINCDGDNNGITDNIYYSGCTPGQLVSPYGVDIDYVTLTLSGWAWSSNFGWISFDRSVTGPPPPGTYDPTVDDAFGDVGPDCANCIAVADRDTANIYGWGRAISACNNNLWDGASCTGSGAGNNAGGWDGWIRFADVSFVASTHRATVNLSPLPDEFEGWAWEGEGLGDPNKGVVGWLSLNCFNSSVCGTSNYKVLLEDFGGEPTAENLTVQFYRADPRPVLPAVGPDGIGGTADDDPGPDGISGNADDGYGSGGEWYCSSNEWFTWDFSDPYPFESQTAYRVQVANDSAFTNIQFDSGKVCNAVGEVFVSIVSSPISASGIDPNQCTSSYSGFTSGSLAYASNYYWRLKTWDITDQESNWVEYDPNGDTIPDAFTTSLHPYPRPNFTWAPIDPSSDDETVIFSDISTASGPTTRLWTIPDGNYVNGTDDTHPGPNFIFNSIGPKTTQLQITDTALEADTNSGSGICYKEGLINVRLPLPDYDEVNPVGFFEK